MAKTRDFFVQPAVAEEGQTIRSNNEATGMNASTKTADAASECDDVCKAERRRKIEERRAMMKQARSSRERSDVLELSRQRAQLYGTSFKGVSCPQGIPCI